MCIYIYIYHLSLSISIYIYTYVHIHTYVYGRQPGLRRQRVHLFDGDSFAVLCNKFNVVNNSNTHNDIM